MSENFWTYPSEYGQEETLRSDVLVLGGGIAGCFAAIAAAERGCSVILVEKGATVRSGSAGSGVDHWESACTNPCSQVTPEEIAEAYVDEQDHFSNGIAHYIECREGYDRLLDLESFGAKIRDTEDEFAGAEFRDDATKLMFAYDYRNRFTLRVWGTTFKPALYRRLKQLGVRIVDHTEATSLLTSGEGGQKRGIGATGMDVRTGRFRIFLAGSTILTMSRPARVWLFDPDLPGLSEFRPMQSIGSGHAMGYRAGIAFTMMEKSVRGEFSAAGRSFPPYSTGNNHNTWYAATMVDARGVEIPYVDRDGNELKTVSERYYPTKGQKFFLKGGVIDNPKYAYRGPETLPFDELIRRGYRLPFYADLSRMPEMERRVIWGMMVGQEGKTKIPVKKSLEDRGFDPARHRLQSYGNGWQSAAFLDQERQLFGAPGGVMHDWDLKTNLDGIYVAGDQLFASDCCGFAAATGGYAGRKAAAAAKAAKADPSAEAGGRKELQADPAQIAREKQRLFAPLDVEDGMDWRELNKAIAKAMQNYCGGTKCDDLLQEGLDLLRVYEEEYVPLLSAQNPHELMRVHEVLDILEVSKLILHACLFRKSTSTPLFFDRSDAAEADPEEERVFITVRQENGRAVRGTVPLDYYGNLKAEYEQRNRDYIASCSDEKKSAGSRPEESMETGIRTSAVEERHPENQTSADAGLADTGADSAPSGASTEGADTATTADTSAVVTGATGIPSKASLEFGVRSSTDAQPTSKPATAAAATGPAGIASHTDDRTGSAQGVDGSASVPEAGGRTFFGTVTGCSVKPLRFDPDLCIGCNRCVNVCQVDIMVPNREKGKPPVVLFPGECYYCGSCVMECPRPGALQLRHPLMNQTRFVPVRPEPEEN